CIALDKTYTNPPALAPPTRRSPDLSQLNPPPRRPKRPRPSRPPRAHPPRPSPQASRLRRPRPRPSPPKSNLLPRQQSTPNLQRRSEEHTSELQSVKISYSVIYAKKK